MVTLKAHSLLTFFALLFSSGVYSNDNYDDRIHYKPIALVNDVSITPYDLTKRINILRYLNNVDTSVKVTAQDRAALLRNVIDEIIKAQETQRFDVTVPPERLDAYIADMARKKNLTKDAFLKDLEKMGVQPIEIEKIFSRQLAWQDLLRGRYGRDISVNTHEVAQLVEGTLKVGDVEVLYDAITLPFDHIGAVREKIKQAEIILKRLQAGEDFKSLQASYQTDITNKDTYISLAQAPQEHHSFLIAAEKNDISSIIQTQNSIDIIKFYDRKSSSGITFDPKVELREASLLKEGRSDQELKKILDEALSVKKPCDHHDEFFDDIKEYPLQKISQYSEELQQVARTMKESASKITAITDEKVDIVSVCQKNKVDYYNDIPAEMRNNIQSKLKQHKLLLKEKEYLRSLRDNAVIHILDMNL